MFFFVVEQVSNISNFNIFFKRPFMIVIIVLYCINSNQIIIETCMNAIPNAEGNTNLVHQSLLARKLKIEKQYAT